MNHDLALVSAVLETGDLAEAIHQGLKPQFMGDEAQAYWDLISDHYNQFHQVPSLDFFQSICPSYAHHPPLDSVEVIVHELKTRYLHNEIDGVVEKVAGLNHDDPWEARRQLAQLADSIVIEVQRQNTDLVAGTDKAEVLKRLEFLRSNDGLLGYAWPWPYLNNASPGLCPGNFAYFYGREGVRKTFLLCFLANWFEQMGLRVLFCTREMSLEEIAWRMYPMRIGIPYQEMVSGNMSSDGQAKLETCLDDLMERKNLIITEIDGGLAGLRAKIEEVKPSIVIHDFMFALAEDAMEGTRTREHEAIGSTANGLKRMAMKTKIPIIACGHANREGVKLKGKNSTEVAGSDKIFRRVDYGFRIIVEDSTDRMAIILNKGRNARKMLSMTLDASLCNGFGTMLDTDTSWVDQVDDVKDAEADSKKRNNVTPPVGKKVERLTPSTFGTGKAVFRV